MDRNAANEEEWADLDGNRCEPDDLDPSPPEIDRPYAVPHPTQFLERGIISSVPFDFGPPLWWRKLTEISVAYDGGNSTVEASLETGQVKFGLAAATLTQREKKAVRNWVKDGKAGPMPLRVTIKSGTKEGLLVTNEYGVLPVLDLAQVPKGLTVAYIYRFTTAKGGKFFRLGWRRQDIGRKLKPRKAKHKSDPSQVEDKSKPT